MTPEAHPQNYLKNTQKILKFPQKYIFFVIFEYFSGNLGGGPFGSFLVIFEYFRVRGIWVSLTGALNRNASAPAVWPLNLAPVWPLIPCSRKQALTDLVVTHGAHRFWNYGARLFWNTALNMQRRRRITRSANLIDETALRLPTLTHYLKKACKDTCCVRVSKHISYFLRRQWAVDCGDPNERWEKSRFSAGSAPLQIHAAASQGLVWPSFLHAWKHLEQPSPDRPKKLTSICWECVAVGHFGKFFWPLTGSAPPAGVTFSLVL